MSMAELEGLLVRLVGDSSSFDKMVDGATKDVDDFVRHANRSGEEFANKIGSQMQRAGASITAVGKAAMTTGAVISAAFGGVIGGALFKAGEFEQTEIAFETMIGSAKETKRTLADLTKFAAETPFQLPEVLAAARGMIQFGERGERLIGTLTTIGNAAAGAKQPFSELALIYNQVRSRSQLMTEELQQFAERGVLSYQDVADHMKVSLGEVQDLLSSGKVSFKEFHAMLEGLSAPGGRFYNLMIKQSKSLLGLTSTLKDIFGAFLRDLGQELLPMAKQIVVATSNMLSGFSDLHPMLKKVIAFATVAGAAFGGFLIATGALLIPLGSLVTALGAIAIAGPPVVAALLPFAPIIAAVGSAVAVVAGTVAVATGVFGYFAYKTGALSEALQQIQHVAMTLWKVIQKTVGGISDAIAADDWALAAEIGWAGIKVAFYRGTEAVLQSVTFLLPKLGKAFTEFFKWMVRTGWNSMKTLAKMMLNPFRAGKIARGFMLEGFTGESLGIAAAFKQQRIVAEGELDMLVNKAKETRTAIDRALAKKGYGENAGTPISAAQQAVIDGTDKRARGVSGLLLPEGSSGVGGTVSGAAAVAEKAVSDEVQSQVESMIRSVETPIEKFNRKRAEVLDLVKEGGFKGQEEKAIRLLDNLHKDYKDAIDRSVDKTDKFAAAQQRAKNMVAEHNQELKNMLRSVSGFNSSRIGIEGDIQAMRRKKGLRSSTDIAFTPANQPLVRQGRRNGSKDQSAVADLQREQQKISWLQRIANNTDPKKQEPGTPAEQAT